MSSRFVRLSYKNWPFVSSGRDGRPAIRRVQLLAPTDEITDADGLLYYSFHAGLRAVIKQSEQFSRLQKDVMFVVFQVAALLDDLIERQRVFTAEGHRRHFLHPIVNRMTTPIRADMLAVAMKTVGQR